MEQNQTLPADQNNTGQSAGGEGAATPGTGTDPGQTGQTQTDQTVQDQTQTDQTGPKPEDQSDFGYTVEMPEGLQRDEDLVKLTTSWARKQGLNQEQFGELMQGLFDLQLQRVKAAQDNWAKQREDAEKTLREEWGDKFDSNLKTAQKAVKEFGGGDLVQVLDTTGLGNHPAMIRLMLKVGQAISEDSLLESGRPRPQINRTAGGAPMLRFPSMGD